MKILIVDDSGTMRRILINVLHQIGYTDIVEAVDGEDALKKFDPSFGFIITDWNMPKMSGLEFARRLRAEPGGDRVPLVMATTRVTNDDLAQVAQVGVNGFIPKPFLAGVLRDRITELVSVLTSGAAA